MRPAGRQRSEVVPIAPAARANTPPLQTATLINERPAESSPSSPLDHRAERLEQLAIAIKQRIAARLGGRIRELEVHARGDTIVVEGRCATYYTKQLAQHAAIGVLEDELLENSIIVG